MFLCLCLPGFAEDEEYPVPYSPLAMAEWFIGEDPGEGEGTPLALAGSSGLARDLAEVTIPVGDLPTGTHEVKIRVQDEAGRWSNPLIRRFTVSDFTIAGGVDPDNPDAANLFPKPYLSLAMAEYFIGTDPGEGEGTPLELAGSPGLARDLSEVTIPVGDLPVGTHEVKVRVRDEAGRWSNPLIRRFTVSDFTIAGGIDPNNPDAANLFQKPYLSLATAEYFVGEDPGEGNGIPLTLEGSPGIARDLEEIPIPVAALPHGTRNVGVRVRDEAGRWSNPLIRRFTIYRQDVQAQQRAGTKLVDLEFDLLHGPRPLTVTVFISNDGGQTWDVPNGSLTGDVGANVVPGIGKQAAWHAGEDWNSGFSEDVRFRVIAYETVQDTPPGFQPVMPGEFAMGSPEEEIGRGGDEAQRQVTMGRPFFLKTTEVTWTEWNAVRNQGPAYGYTDIAAGRNGLNGDGGGNHPVTEVSWLDAVKWCNLRSEIEGRRPVYHASPSLNPATVVRTGIPDVHPLWNASGYRLPTEAEWERACRAGTATAFSSGEITDATADANLDAAGWYAANSGGNTRPVAGKPANPLGFRDLHGNVREWCWDAYGSYPAGPQWDPVTGADGAARVLRGGSWNLSAAACRSAARSSGGRNSRATDIGFRVALNFQGGTMLENAAGVPVDSRNPEPGNLIAGLRPSVNGTVLAMVSQPDGKIVIGGDFSTVDGVTRNRIARLNVDGTLDGSFNPGADSTVHALAVLADGKILMGGDFSSVASGPADYLARVNADGTLDAAFQPGVDYVVRALAIQPDGKIVIGGDFQWVGGATRNRVARLDAEGTLDAAFDANADGPVRALALQADGKILLGGDFTTVGGQARDHLARVNADGTPDGAFLADADGPVTSLAVQANGQILAGGEFFSLGGAARAGLGRLSASGVVDAGFLPEPDGAVHALALQADGKIVVAGEFTGVGGAGRMRLARLAANGTADAAFNLNFDAAVHTLALLPDGKLVAAGDFGSVSGVARQRIAWLDNEPSTETLAAMSSSRVRWLRGGAAAEAGHVGFSISTDGGATWLPLGNAGRISGGWEQTGVNLPASGLLRAEARIPAGRGNGSAGLEVAETAFSGLVTIPEIAVETETGADLPDGGSHSFGVVTMGAGRTAVFRILNLGYGDLTGLTISKDGENPTDFQVTVPPVAPVPGPDGFTMLEITFTPGDIGERSAWFRIANNDANENPFDIHVTGAGVIAGQPADDFNPAVSNRVNAIAVQPDGKVVIGGTFTNIGGTARGRFARLNPDLSLESTASFAAGSGANTNVLAAAIQPDGKILIAGQFTSINAQARARIARIQPDGVLEPTATFNTGTGPNNTVQALAVQPDGKILIAGDFTTVNGQSRPRIARLNADGTLEAAATFNIGTGAAGGTVSSLALQADGRILLGGAFSSVNGEPRAGLARLMPDGSLDPSFAPEVDDKVSSLAVQPDGKIVLGGLFTTIGGEPRAGIARLRPDGQVEDNSAFDPGTGTDGEVTSIALQADGGILIAGSFQLVNDEPRAGIARLYPNGTLESPVTFDTVVGPDEVVRAVALRPDGAVVVGGDFTDYNGFQRGRLALLANQPAVDELTVSGNGRIDWNRAGTAPEIVPLAAELSADGGESWSPLPAWERKTGGWEIEGLSLPSSGLVRARGRTSGGFANGSGGLVETVRVFVNPPALATLPASGVGMDSAVLNGTVTPNGAASVFFEYGPTTAYGFTTQARELSGSLPLNQAEEIGGLSGLYHFRIVAVTSGGTYYGEDSTFVTAPVPPLAVTANPVAVSPTGATLVGAVNPRGRETTVYFEYGATTLYGNTTEPQIIPAGNNAVEVIDPITGLNAGATYHYRIVAENSGGTAYGSDVSFQATSGGTTTAPPSVVTGGATETTTTGAILNGTVNPNGGFTNAFFEYGTTPALGSVSPALGAGNGSVPANLFWTVAGLEPGTVYHYRLVAVNSLGTTQGSMLVFTTNFPAPLAVTGGAEAISTTAARVSGSVRARHAATQVFCDFGTDGVTFPNSVSAVPATVTGDEETPVTADLVNLQQGVTYHYRIRAVSGGGTTMGETGSFTPAILSGLTRVFPAAPSSTAGTLMVTLNPAGIASGWRFTGEREWRASGSTATGLTAGDRQVEFRPVPGHIHPLPEIVSVTGGGVAREYDYYETEAPATGGLTVLLKPDDLSDPGVPDEERPKWRLLGENESQWKNGGETLAGLPEGRHLIEFREAPGRATPPVAAVTVEAGETSTVTITYFLSPSTVGAAPVPLDFATVSTDQSLPYAHIGQIRSDAGLASGFVVKPRVVATAAHVVFDDGSLSFVTGLQWLFQRDRNVHEPVPQVPRGFYVFDGYAALREAENTPGDSSPQSQNLDVATLYFNEDAGRGGSYGGFLASDTLVNEFLISPALKTLAGYPVDGVSAALRGRMHATAPVNAAFTAGYGRTHSTADLRGTGGMSGGPLCVRHPNGNYYPAAIYLGGSAQAIVRAIDSDVIELFNRAENSANGGPPHTGGGITHTSVSGIPNPGNPGIISIIIKPPAGFPDSAVANARWGLSPETPARPGGSQRAGLSPGNYILQLNAIPGFQTPLPQTVQVTGGQTRVVTFTYVASLPPPPVITSSGGVTVAHGQPLSYQIAATNSPTSYSLTGTLPGGVTFHAGTGLISGIPQEAGNFPVTVRATNAGGTGSRLVTFTVNAPSHTPLEEWRFLHFGTTENTGIAADHEDADHDGQSNLAEYHAGTDPKNPADVFKTLSTVRTGNTFTLTVPGKAGRVYQLQRRDNLSAGPWTPVVTTEPLGADGAVELTDPAAHSPHAFYRVWVELAEP